MTILALALLLILAFIVWLLILSIYGNHHTDEGDEWTEPEDCSTCEGSGLFAKACWDSPSIPCDDCNGTGEEPA